MCCFHMGMALKGGGVKACHGLKHFFSYVCPFDRGGGGGLKLLGNAHRTNTFKKGASLTQDNVLRARVPAATINAVK